MNEYPGRVVHYSETQLLQKMILERCRRLPGGFDTLAAWEAYRDDLLRFLADTLPLLRPGTEREPSVTSRVPLAEDLLLETVDVPLQDEFDVPVHLYRPKDLDGPVPAVLVCPGYAQAKNDPGIVDACIAFARSGMVAVAAEYGGTGERADRPDPATDIENVTALGHLLGITNVGLRVFTNLAVLELLRGRAEVDSGALGITGLCQGAIVTWYTAALEPAFAAVAPLCGATTYEAVALEYVNRQGGWSGISPYVFNLLSRGDVHHVLASVAPRPLLVQNNIVDPHWPMSGFGTVKRFVTSVYELYGAPERVAFRLEHAPHAYAPPFVKNIVAFFAAAFGLEQRTGRQPV